jgi:beta-lactamase regulating signal transducer with metallopeptidase domain
VNVKTFNSSSGANGYLFERTQERAAALVPWSVIVWLVGVILFTVRFTGGWLTIQQIKRTGNEPVPNRWEQTFEGLVDRLCLWQRIRFLQSTLVEVPTVAGWIRPVVLIPPSILVCMPVAHLEALVAHELAHIRRHDYLINLFQAVVETVLFYHPAVWWVSRQIRIEREYSATTWR